MAATKDLIMSAPVRRLLVAAALAVLCTLPAASQSGIRHVVVITLDGLRWQEFFTGADRSYFKRAKDGKPGAAEQRFWRATVPDRRMALMPFVWTTIAGRGQVFGDPASDSVSQLTNGLWFSYPGYSEMFTGIADPRINSNDKVPNPNVTVLEWLNQRPGFEGRVAAFGAWDVLPYILNVSRSTLVVGSGFEPYPQASSADERAINDLAADLPRLWDYGPVDAPIVYAALEYARVKQPRVFYIMLGEGDEWAHEGRYDLYLDATHRADRYIERVWTTLQSMPAYANQTALVVTTDHGRGATKKDWNDHGEKIPAAQRTWMAMLGNGVAPLGVRHGTTVTTSQIAATVASLAGEDFKQANPQAAAAIDLSR